MVCKQKLIPFSWSLQSFWVLVLALGTLNHLAASFICIRRNRLRPLEVDYDSVKVHRRRRFGALRTWLQRPLSSLPCVSNDTSGPLPTLGEALVLATHVTLTFVFCFPGIHIMKVSLLE